jgi:hypothetical protein
MPEDGRVRTKHVVEDYTQDKYENENVACKTVITRIYKRQSPHHALN